MRLLFLLLPVLLLAGCREEEPGSLFPRIDRETGEYWFFYYDSSASVQSVALAGSFNGWSATATPMKKRTDHLWSASIKLAPGRREQYKVVLNGTKWIPDPNAPYITMDQWRNSVIQTIRPDEFGLMFSSPIADGASIRPEFIRLVFNDPKSILPAASVVVTLNGRPVRELTRLADGEIRVPIHPDLHGEIQVEIQIGHPNLNWYHSFLVFVWSKPIDLKTPPQNDAMVLYEIYIRQFADSNGDGTGDLNGITGKLPYLDSLGVTGLWLMPFNESPRDHGYAINDYLAIDREYGIMEDFRQLAMAADERGIDLWMDFVINHTDTTHPWFLDIRKKGKESRYWTWFQMTGDQPLSWKYFGMDDGMPKLNFQNPEVQDYFLKMAEFWMDPDQDGDFSDGVDGFRCDAAIEVPHSYWKRFRAHVKKIRPDVTILGEIWVADQLALLPFYDQEFDMTFDYPLYYTLRDAIHEQKPDLLMRFWQPMRQEVLPSGAQWVTFTSNHDNFRSLSLFRENRAEWNLAQNLLFALPGTPMVYYGDEAGLTGKNPPDTNVRQKMVFPAPTSDYYQTYRSLIALRKTFPVLAARDYKESPTLTFSTPEPGLLIVHRSDGNQKLTGYFNLSPAGLTFKMPYSGKPVTWNGTAWTVGESRPLTDLPAYGVSWLIPD